MSLQGRWNLENMPESVKTAICFPWHSTWFSMSFHDLGLIPGLSSLNSPLFFVQPVRQVRLFGIQFLNKCLQTKWNLIIADGCDFAVNLGLDWFSLAQHRMQTSNTHTHIHRYKILVHAWSFREPGSAPSATDHFVWLSHVHGTVFLPASQH